MIRYVLSVTENYHLESIWSMNQEVALLNGRIHFQYNPKLCYEDIIKIRPSIKSSSELPIEDVLIHTNGESVVCKLSICIYIKFNLNCLPFS